MRQPPNARIEPYRVRTGILRSRLHDGNNGAFEIPLDVAGHPTLLLCLANDVQGWEHVSVRAVESGNRSRIPTYWEMQFIKEHFWTDDEVVMQLHVAKKDHLNLHPHVLHLWRPIDKVIPLPPSKMVAPKDDAEWHELFRALTKL